MEKRHNYVRKVAETAVQLFISSDKVNVAGLILAGSADFKTELSQSDMFDPELPTYVQDTAHALCLLQDFRFPGPQRLIFTTDIQFLYTWYVEQSLFRCYTGTIPHFFHFIDDCIGTASCSHKELEQFINFTNAFHPNLKFTWTISNTSLSFLDLSVSISDDRLITNIYFKPTDSQSYLDYTSSHPPSCKNAVPYSKSSASTTSTPKMGRSTPAHPRCPPISRI
eukprot:g38838.t1